MECVKTKKGGQHNARPINLPKYPFANKGYHYG